MPECKPHVIAFMDRLNKKIHWAKRTRHTSKCGKLIQAYLWLGKRNGYFNSVPF